MRVRCCFILMLLLLADHANAQAPLRFDPVEGLSHNTVYAITQDQQGFMWFGTADGLNRYDGYRFEVYRHNPGDPLSLSHNTVRALYEDPSGNFWVASESGLDLLDASRQHFQAIDYVAPAPLTINSLTSADGATLWFTHGEALFRYDPPATTTTVLNTWPDFAIHFIRPDTLGALWLDPTDSETFRPEVIAYVPSEEQTETYILPTAWPTPDRIDVVPGPSGTVWVSIGTAVGMVDRDSHMVRPRPDLPAGTVLLEDRRGGLWLEDDLGLLRVDLSSRTPQRYTLDATGTNALTQGILSMFEDQVGALWVGTRSGLFRYDPQGKAFRHLTHDPRNPHSLSSNIVMALHETTERALWVGTLGGGLNRVNLETGLATPFRHSPTDPQSLCDDRVWALQETSDGTLWVGTDAGLCWWHPTSRSFQPMPLTAAGSPYVYVLTVNDGQLWVGGEDIHRVDPASKTHQTYTLTSCHNVQALHPNPDGSLWVGTEFCGLLHFDPATGTETLYPHVAKDTTGLFGRSVRTIVQDPSNEQVLWLGTDLGLVRFDLRTETFRHYLQADGLPGSVVFGIVPDDAGYLWVSTNQNLARFDPRTEQFLLYTREDGTGNTEYNRRAAHRGASGTFYFGGINGVTAFVPDALTSNRTPPPLALTDIRISNRDATRSVPPHSLEGLTLSYRDYTFAFTFAALSYTNPTANRYAYRLDGFDPNWVEAGTQREARYTNIPPGRYTFRVKGANADGVWNEDGLALPLTIAPPFWQTWWFRVLVVTAVAGLLYATYRYRVAQLLRVERLRMRIASDLHDDIGSKLSSIALMSEMVTRRATLGEREHTQLNEVTRTARTMVDDLREIVWMVNPRYDRLENLIGKMQHLAGTMLDGLSHSFHAPEASRLTDTLGMAPRRHLYLLYKETLHNIVRHAHATHVRIDITRTNGRLALEIKDDGVGFDTTTVTAGNGLANLHDRARAAGGTLAISSTPGTGTTVQFNVKIPDLRDGTPDARFRP